MLKLAIDPGHGFGNKKPGVYDPGACAAGVAEADIALAWALTLKWACREAGVECFLTRDDDSDSDPVGRRDDVAAQAGCTLFLSLHCNAGGGHGTETYYRNAEDKVFADMVQRCALSALGLPSRGLKFESESQHSRLAVLDFGPPACLLEIGFIDNAVDRAAMLKRESRIAFARRLIGEIKSRYV